MAQRDFEEQPEAPDLGASAQLESAEHLAGPAGGADALDPGVVPPDRPYGLDDDAVTARAQRAGESLDRRLERERAEGPEGEPDRSGRLRIADGGAALETADATSGEDVGIDGGAASAEEAAVHEVGADSRADGEPRVADDPALADPQADERVREGLEGADGPDRAARIDAQRDAAGAAAPASGREDAGTVTPRSWT